MQSNKNLKPDVLERFLANPEDMFNGSFELWGTSSFVNASGILQWLMENEPNSPLVPRVTKKMVEYMKYCYDNDKEFPWRDTFESSSEEESKQMFVAFYAIQHNG